MTETNVFQLSQPGMLADPLTEVRRNGARALLAQAVAAEVAALLSRHADKLTDDGRPDENDPCRIRRSFAHEVDRGRPAAVILDSKFDVLTLIERTEARLLDRRNVDEHVSTAATGGLDEAIALLRI